MPHLFSPFTLRDVTVKNRIGMSPMCQYSASDGFVNAWHIVHLGSRAAGGAGLIIMEATAVEPRGRISVRDTGLWSDDHIDPLLHVNDFLSSQGTIAGIQLAHAGRKASAVLPWHEDRSLTDEEGGWKPVSPSPIPYCDNYREPGELTIEEIADIQKSFRLAAKRANEAGFKFLDLHAAHGYLIHTFLSPLTNKRKDQYGGSFENRIRFLVETVREVRKEWPDTRPLSVRISCKDWVEGGWTLKDSIDLTSKLKWEGVDLIACTSGGLLPDIEYPAGAGWQVPLAEKIRNEAGLATAAVGMIAEPMQADSIVRNGRADLVLLGRALLQNPFWPYHAARILDKTKLLPYPEQYKVIGKKRIITSDSYTFFDE